MRRSRHTVGLAAIMAMAVLVAPAAVDAQGGSGRLAGLDGGALTRAQLEKGDSILVFWTSWSPRCRNIVEQVDPIHSSWNGKARVAMINWQEDAEEVRTWLAGRSPKAPVFLDPSGAFAKELEVVDLPGLVIYKNGEVAYQGKLPRDPDALIARVLG